MASERATELAKEEFPEWLVESVATIMDKAVAEERQECAKVAAMMRSEFDQSQGRLACTYIVDAIRARGTRLDREKAASTHKAEQEG